MNLLFLTLAYHPQALDEVSRASRDGLQNQINSYQWAFMEGIRQNLGEGETLDVVNALPVGVFPLRYRKLWLRRRRLEPRFLELGGVNLPWLKQRGRQAAAFRAIRAWAKASPENRSILLYSLYLPYMRAVAKARALFPDVKATVIVTDLPNELGIASGRRGLLKKLEYAMGREKHTLCAAFDGFVLLTRHMAEALPVAGKARMVMEGLILPQPGDAGTPRLPEGAESSLPVVLYSGTLNRELGVGDLLEAFAGMPEYALWLCGRGDMEKEARQACQRHPNLRYFGFVSQAEALALQSRADALINPRAGEGRFTRYSFPSKTLEYMRSGKPVLCYRLEGIPEDYDEYLIYMRHGIQAAVRELFALAPEKRREMGEAARQYVLAEKGARKQSERLLSFLRRLLAEGLQPTDTGD